jgi:hypothetical protein
MTQCDSPTIEQLLADSLIRAVMRADRVEPQALKSLMERAADRIALGTREHKAGRGAFFVNSAFDRAGVFAPVAIDDRARPRAAGEPCRTALCW